MAKLARRLILSISHLTLKKTTRWFFAGWKLCLSCFLFLSAGGGSLINAIIPKPKVPKGPEGVIRRVWKNFRLGHVRLLPRDPRFPKRPDFTEIIPFFDAPINQMNYFGQQLIGYFSPPFTGLYTFYISVDDEAELYVSKDSSPKNKRRYVYLKSVTGHNKFFR